MYPERNLPLTALVAMSAALANAQSNTTVYRGSMGPGHIEDNPRFGRANLNPNVTNSAQFAPFYVGGVFNDGLNAIDEDNQWTWRINVSDFAVPDARPAFPGEQPPFTNPHVTNTVHELQWPSGGNFRSALNGSTAQVCLSINANSFRPNVTNLFTDDNDSADCGPVLGDECVDAILSATGGSDLDTCSGLGLTDIPECASTLGASRSYEQFGLSYVSTNINSNRTAQNGTFEDLGYGSIANGTDGEYAIFSSSTQAYNATNTTLYDEATSRLYVMVLSISPYQETFGLWSRHVLCMRPDARELEIDQQESPDEEDSSGSEADSTTSSDNAAPTQMPAVGKFGSAVSAAGLGLGLYALL